MLLHVNKTNSILFLRFWYISIVTKQVCEQNCALDYKTTFIFTRQPFVYAIYGRYYLHLAYCIHFLKALRAQFGHKNRKKSKISLKI